MADVRKVPHIQFVFSKSPLPAAKYFTQLLAHGWVRDALSRRNIEVLQVGWEALSFPHHLILDSLVGRYSSHGTLVHMVRAEACIYPGQCCTKGSSKCCIKNINFGICEFWCNPEKLHCFAIKVNECSLNVWRPVGKHGWTEVSSFPYADTYQHFGIIHGKKYSYCFKWCFNEIYLGNVLQVRATSQGKSGRDRFLDLST